MERKDLIMCSAAHVLLYAKLNGLAACPYTQISGDDSHSDSSSSSGDTSADEPPPLSSKALKKLNEAPGSGGEGWQLLRTGYELYPGHLCFEVEAGGLLFVDKTLSRFIMVDSHRTGNCPTCDCFRSIDHWYLLELRAQRLFNAICYLSVVKSGPKWLRATYTTPDCPEPLDKLFSVASGTVRAPTGPSGLEPVQTPHIIHFNSKKLEPVLSANDLIALDCLLLRAGLPLPSKETRKRVPKLGAYKHVCETMWHEGYQVHNSWVTWQCEECGKAESMELLNRCAACRIAFFCDRDCQRKAWKEHKKVYMPREG